MHTPDSAPVSPLGSMIPSTPPFLHPSGMFLQHPLPSLAGTPALSRASSRESLGLAPPNTTANSWEPHVPTGAEPGFGISITNDHIIVDIKDGSDVALWNLANPHLDIRIGDMIRSVGPLTLIDDIRAAIGGAPMNEIMLLSIMGMRLEGTMDSPTTAEVPNPQALPSLASHDALDLSADSHPGST